MMTTTFVFVKFDCGAFSICPFSDCPENEREEISANYERKGGSVFRAKSLHLCEVHSSEMGDPCHMKFCNRIMRKPVTPAPRRTSTNATFSESIIIVALLFRRISRSPPGNKKG